MAFALVQPYAEAWNAAATLGSAPTPGNIIVAAVFRRSGSPTLPSGFTAIVHEGGAPWSLLAYRVVQSGDGQSVTAVDQNRIFIAEFSGILPPANSSDYAYGTLPLNTTTEINPPGTGVAIGIGTVHVDFDGRRYFIVSPSTQIVHNAWLDGWQGPRCSFGYDATGSMSMLAENGSQDAARSYIVATFPLKATGRSQSVVLV